MHHTCGDGGSKIKGGYEWIFTSALPTDFVSVDSILFGLFLFCRRSVFLSDLQFRFDLADEIDESTSTD